MAQAEFHRFGFGEPIAISSAHKQGLDALLERAFEGLEGALDAPDVLGFTAGTIRVAVVGRPNVGKSTLINRLLGEERLIAFDQPGTTRDTVEVPFERDGQPYVLIDTAGVRRRAKVNEAVEKFSIVKTLQAIDRANVVIGVLDAHDTIAEQDASLMGLVAEQGRALVLASTSGTASRRTSARRSATGSTCASTSCASPTCISSRRGTARASAR
jgi:GTPase